MSSKKFKSRKFVSVDPSKCTGCGICEYSCTLEKGEKAWNPIRSRIRVVRMTPLFNFALACRFCEDAKCVDSCPEDALTQSEGTGIILVNDKKCMGCDWCVQACPHGGITLHTDTGKAIACDLCDGEPNCVEFCPAHVLALAEIFNQKGYHPPEVVDADACTGCDLCGMYCPDFAIFGVRIKKPNNKKAA